MHIGVPAPKRQRAARQALATTPRRKMGGTFSPQPPPRGGGSSRSQGGVHAALVAPHPHHTIVLAPPRPTPPPRVRIGGAAAVAAQHPHRGGGGLNSFLGSAAHGASVLLGGSALRDAAGNLIHGHDPRLTHEQFQADMGPTSVADKAFLKSLAPQSIVDIAHGHAPSKKHLGEDALFFAPWSRTARAFGEGAVAGVRAGEGARAAEAAGRAAESFKSGKGLGDAAYSGAKKLLPSERALGRSVARQKLFAHIDAHLPRAHAQAVKRTVDQSIKAMVRNGQARNVEEAVGRIADTRVGEIPDEIKGLYQTVPPKAPPEMPARLHVKGLPHRVYKLIQQGAAYRDWYSRGAKVLADAADRLSISRAQMAAVTAVMSQGANPTFNLRRAVEAIQEFKATGQIDPSRYLGGQAEKVAHILSSPDTFNWTGLKTNSYFGNFLEELDPALYKQLYGSESKVTVDRHMAAMFLGKKSVTEKQYLQVEKILTEVADQLGWQPKEVQAAAWVPFKAGNLQESATVRALSREMTANGEIPAELLGPGKAMSQKRAAFVREQLAAGRMPQGYTPSPLETYMPTAADAYERGQQMYRGTLYQRAEPNIANDTFNPRVAQVTSEANPDPQLWPRLRAAYDKLSPEEQATYSRAMDEAQAGVFEHVLGLDHMGNREGLGIWRGAGQTGAASHILVGTGPISPELRADMDALTAAQGMAKHQNSVSWGRPVPPREGEFHGIHWTPPAGEDPVRASAALDTIAGDGNVGFIHAPDGGFYVINFSGDQGADFAIRRLGGEQTDIGWQGGYTIDSRIKTPDDTVPSYQEAIDSHPKANELHAAMTQVRKRVEQIDAHFLGGHIARIVDKQEAEQLAEAGTHVFHGTTPMHAEQIMAERTLRTGDANPEAAWTTVNPDTADWYANGFTGDGERKNIVAIPREKIPMGEGDAKHPLGNYGSPDNILFQRAAEEGPILGAFETTDAGRRAVFHLSSLMDVTTVPHELAHFLEHFGLSTEDKVVIEKWTGPLDSEAAHEKFARGLEALVRSGDAPNNLVKEFNTLRPAFAEKYGKAGDLPQVPGEVAAVYKKLLGHRDGVPASLYFALRNVATGAANAGKRGPDRSPEEAAQHVAEVAARMRSRGFGTLVPEVTRLKPGEVSAETGGEAGAAVRRALAGKVDTEGMGTYEALGAKMDTLPAHQARDLQEEARHVERVQRVAKIVKAAERKQGLERHLAAKAQMGGEYTSAYWRGFKGPVEDNLNFLVDHIYEHPGLQPWEKSNATDALLNGIQRGKVPTKSEQKLLERAFGKEIQGGIKAAVLGGTLEQRVANVANIPRAFMASGDLSAPFRQGLVVMASHPSIFWEGFGPMLKAARSEKVFQAEVAAIHGMDTFPLMDRAKLSLTDIGTSAKGIRDLAKREEGFQSNLAEQVPVVGHMVRGSDRAYVLFLNRTRARLFNVLVQQAAENGWDLNNEKLLEDIAKFVNSATGRGDIGKLADHTASLNALFFSPRLMASRFNFLYPPYYLRMEPFARQQALRAATRLAGTISTILYFAHLAGAQVTLDPRNADFGKIRIGNTRMDIAGGFGQPIRLISQLTSGTIISSSTGRAEKLSGGFAGESRFDVGLQFLENKLAPVPSTVVDLAKGKGFGNTPLKPAPELANHMVPLLWQDIYEVYKGTGAKGAIGYGIPDLFGVSVSNYAAPGPKTKQDTNTLLEQSKQAGLGAPPRPVVADVKWKSLLDSKLYDGQSALDKVKVTMQVFDQRYGTNLEAQILPHVHTEGQAEALYLKLRDRIFPALSQWQRSVNHVLNVQKGQEPVQPQAPQKSSAPATSGVKGATYAPSMQPASYHIPAAGASPASAPSPTSVPVQPTGVVPDALTLAADQGLADLANGMYDPSKALGQLFTSLSQQPLQNTVAIPNPSGTGDLGHVKFQIPKLSGPVGKAARGAIALAQAYLGTPYVWGGESPKGFDCSGLLQYIYAKQGISIPRTSQTQYRAGTSVPKSRLRPGDAVFFVGSDGTRSAPGHVGIYIGHGKFIEAPHTGATVRVSNLAGYPGYVGARRYTK